MNESSAHRASLYERIGGHDGIMRLIFPFYEKVRGHPVLGPIFNERITDWTVHLAKIAEFWAGVTGGTSTYRGGMGRHFSLPVGAEHFEFWLGMWAENANAQLPPEEAAEMIQLAHHVGDDLQRMMGRYQPQFGREFDVQSDG